MDYSTSLAVRIRAEKGSAEKGSVHMNILLDVPPFERQGKGRAEKCASPVCRGGVSCDVTGGSARGNLPG